jgi:hypothetical protein
VTINHRALIAFAFLLALPVPAKEQGASTTIKSAMTSSEYSASGIASLGPQQQAALDHWLNRFALSLFNISCGGGVYNNIDEKQSIENNAEGRILILDDDSIWLVESVDRVDSSLWLETEDVVVTKAKGSNGFDYTIIDLDDKESVHAKYLGND